MMADHGDPCEEQEVSYCMNGATCYKISSMNSLSCVCTENYRGSRCEHFWLSSLSPSAEHAGLIAAVVIVALLIFVVLAVVIYCIHNFRSTKRRQKNIQHQYWRIQPRV
uniref:EGF-like domain-containing protein n=1 Tax=Salarias fasciatus TaxID=181472 RepID=A0A672IJ38_SALFA